MPSNITAYKVAGWYVTSHWQIPWNLVNLESQYLVVFVVGPQNLNKNPATFVSAHKTTNVCEFLCPELSTLLLCCLSLKHLKKNQMVAALHKNSGRKEKSIAISLVQVAKFWVDKYLSWDTHTMLPMENDQLSQHIPSAQLHLFSIGCVVHVHLWLGLFQQSLVHWIAPAPANTATCLSRSGGFNM